jgi:hypothetical protein
MVIIYQEQLGYQLYNLTENRFRLCKQNNYLLLYFEMKRTFIFIVLTTVTILTFSQEREKEAHYNYLSIAASVYTNTAGSFNEKVFMTAEAGRTYGIFDIGVLVGKRNFIHSDTSWFVEALPTINVFSKGRFSEALTLGAGYVINAKENFLTEITNSINFAPSNKLVITVYQGNYFFDGRLSTSKAQFMGLSFTFNFIKSNTSTDIKKRKSLLN